MRSADDNWLGWLAACLVSSGMALVKPTPVHQFTYSYLSMTVYVEVLVHSSLRSFNWFLAQLILHRWKRYSIAVCEKKELKSCLRTFTTFINHGDDKNERNLLGR